MADKVTVETELGIDIHEESIYAPVPHMGE
jgi:hypothetical protein